MKSNSQEPTEQVTGALITAEDLAKLLAVSVRHIWRMADSGALPRALRLGRCVRWRRADIEEWIMKGCPTNATREELKARIF